LKQFKTNIFVVFYLKEKEKSRILSETFFTFAASFKKIGQEK
jgi:hypothetical protein